MFKPLAMKHVLIELLNDDMPALTLTLARLAVFSPDTRPMLDDKLPHVPGERYREIYHQAESRLEKIRKHVPLDPEPVFSNIHVVTEGELAERNKWLGETWERCSDFEERLHHLLDEERMVDQLDHALDNFATLKIDLGLLQGQSRFLDIHIGIVPRKNVAQLREALSLANCLLYSYMDHEDNTHVVVVGMKQADQAEIASVLDTAGFRALPIPPELRDEPKKVRAELLARRDKVRTERSQLDARLAVCARELKPTLEECRRVLLMAQPFVLVDNAAHSGGHLVVLSGWIPARDIDRTREALDGALQFPYHISPRDPVPDERRLVPSFMPKNRFMTPFSTLVKQYGVPRYGEFDPTFIFALTFIAMFGMMFGDVGHGLTIVAAAWFLRHTLKTFTPFVIGIGLSATLFGVLYGSVFGYEHLFHAAWTPPLSDPLYMLSMALMWGVGFLIVITAISIHNRLVSREFREAVFENNGLVSITLYIAVLWGVFNLYRQGYFGVLPAVISILALLTLLIYKLLETEASPGERVLVAVVETYETLTGYVSNTLSFLRVAAFSLNHVALAIAVFTLADMMGTTGHWITVVLGNIFILVLEGAIVTIQALRLEYYEGFSRFFSGDGIEFKPLRMAGGVHP